MMLKDIAPILTTEKLSETIELYTKVLGVECDGHDKQYGRSSASRDNVVIMFGVPA
jgi:hypothetical protein